MGFRQFFQRHRTTGDTPQTGPVPTAAVELRDGAPLPPEHMADLQEAWAELARAAEGSGENGFRACTRNGNGRPWEEDPDSVRAVAALLRDHRNSKEGVRAILDDENLVHYNWFEDRYQDEYEAGIQKVDTGWRVYYADEKAGAIFDREYANEAEAMTKFLDLARHNTRSWKKRRGRADTGSS